jgi:hypothetical protein
MPYSILLCNNAESSKDLRELAAGIIISNPDKYSTAMLGRTREDYTQWLLREQSWGGTYVHAYGAVAQPSKFF